MRYLIATHIAVESRGPELLVDHLWHADLAEAIRHADRLFVLAPVRSPRGDRDVLARPLGSLDLGFRPLGTSDALPLSITNQIRVVRAAWSAVGDADLVHVTAAGGRPPVSWLVGWLAIARGRPLVLVVESAPWRGRGERSRRARAIAGVCDRMTRGLARRATAAVFTTREYRDRYGSSTNPCHRVVSASWVPEEAFIDDAEAAADWRVKAGEELRVAFVGRLTPEKGVHVLIETLELLRGSPIEVLVYGDGSALPALRRAERLHTERPRLRLMGTMPYGPDFLGALRSMHCVVVPTLGDEQPRIVLDAASQGVCTVGSDTPGLREVVAPGVTGLLVAAGDPDGLAEALRALDAERDRLADLGRAALRRSRSQTHEAMHAERAALFAGCVTPRAEARRAR